MTRRNTSAGAVQHARELLERIYARAAAGKPIPGDLERAAQAIQRLPRNQQAGELARIAAAIDRSEHGRTIPVSRNAKSEADLEEVLDEIAQLDARLRAQEEAAYQKARARRVDERTRRNPASVAATVLFDPRRFTIARARAWLTRNGYSARKVERVARLIRAQQRPPSRCQGPFTTLSQGFPPGVQVIACRPRARKNPGPNVRKIMAALKRLRSRTGKPYQLAGSLGRTCVVLRGKRITKLLNPSDLLRYLGRARLNHPCGMEAAQLRREWTGNPGRGLSGCVVLYPRVEHVEATETRKGYRGKPPGLYRHKYTSHPPVLGVGPDGAEVPPGSIVLPATKKPLWNIETVH